MAYPVSLIEVYLPAVKSYTLAEEATAEFVFKPRFRAKPMDLALKLLVFQRTRSCRGHFSTLPLPLPRSMGT